MAKAPYTADWTQRKPERSLEEGLSEIQREIQVRERCFSRWVTDGKMTAVEARDRFARMESAWLYLDKMLTLQSTPDDGEGEPPTGGSQEAP